MPFINPVTNLMAEPAILPQTYTLALGNGEPLTSRQQQALAASWEHIIAHCAAAPAVFEVFRVEVRYGQPEVVRAFAVSTANLYVVGMLPPGVPQPFPALDYGEAVPGGPLNYGVLVHACNAVANAPAQAGINETGEFRWVCFLVSEAARQETARDAVLAALADRARHNPALVEYRNHLSVINNWMHIATSSRRSGPPSVNRVITRDDMQRYFLAHPLAGINAERARSIGAAQ